MTWHQKTAYTACLHGGPADGQVITCREFQDVIRVPMPGLSFTEPARVAHYQVRLVNGRPVSTRDGLVYDYRFERSIDA